MSFGLKNLVELQPGLSTHTARGLLVLFYGLFHMSVKSALAIEYIL